MKDKEIIHALSCCSTRNCKFGGCLFDDGNSDDVENCTTEMAKAALDLINRQQEEIESLTEKLEAMGDPLEKAHYTIAEQQAEIERLTVNMNALHRNSLNKTVFLTKEEAEQALKGGGKE